MTSVLFTGSAQQGLRQSRHVMQKPEPGHNFSNSLTDTGRKMRAAAITLEEVRRIVRRC